MARMRSAARRASLSRTSAGEGRRDAPRRLTAHETAEGRLKRGNRFRRFASRWE